MAKSLYHFLNECENLGDVVRVDSATSHQGMIAAHIRASCNIEGPALMFENVTADSGDHYSGSASFRVAGAVFGSRRRLQRVLWESKLGSRKSEFYLGDSPVEDLSRYRSLVETGTPLARKGNLFHATINPYELLASDLSFLPICKYSEKDSGSFITAGVQIVPDPRYSTRDVDSGIECPVMGMGIHRMRVLGPLELSIMAPPERRIGKAFLHNEDRGKDTPIAIVIGGPPALVVASQTRFPHWLNKYGVMAAIAGETRVDIVKLNNGVFVPPNAEIVLEGRIIRGERYNDAPFGEFCGTYSMRAQCWKVEIDNIWRQQERDRTLYHAILTGMPPNEDVYLGSLPMCEVVWRRAAEIADVTGVTVYRGNGLFDAHVSIKKRQDGEPWNVAMAVLGGNQTKTVTVYDDDIDPNSDYDRLWAWNTRVQPDQDILILPQMVGASLDPGGAEFRHTSKVAIDATVFHNRYGLNRGELEERHARIRVPGWDRIDTSKWRQNK